MLLRINPLAFDVGIKLLTSAIRLSSDKVELERLADCMAIKSDSAINKRSVGMMKFVTYCKEIIFVTKTSSPLWRAVPMIICLTAERVVMHPLCLATSDQR